MYTLTIFVSYLTMQCFHCRGHLGNQIDKNGVLLGYQSASLHSHSSAYSKGSWQSSPGGKNGGYTCAQQLGFPLTKAHLANITTNCLVCQKWSRDNTEFLIWHHSQGRWASHLLAGWLHWTSSIIEGTKICPHWNNQIFWICLFCS